MHAPSESEEAAPDGAWGNMALNSTNRSRLRRCGNFRERVGSRLGKAEVVATSRRHPVGAMFRSQNGGAGVVRREMAGFVGKGSCGLECSAGGPKTSHEGACAAHLFARR